MKNMTIQILKLIELQNQFRFLHWQTKSYAKHMAYGSIYESLDDLIDSFMESYMGKYGRPEFDEEFTLKFKDISAISLQSFIDSNSEFLIGLTDVLDAVSDSDLLNIRDEMLGLLNKIKYLLTLK